MEAYVFILLIIVNFLSMISNLRQQHKLGIAIKDANDAHVTFKKARDSYNTGICMLFDSLVIFWQEHNFPLENYKVIVDSGSKVKIVVNEIHELNIDLAEPGALTKVVEFLDSRKEDE